MTDHHPSTRYWSFPPADRALPAALTLSAGGQAAPAVLRGALAIQRVNLRELAARPQRFEHHLVVLGRAGDAQLEMATASEPLYFAHANISDEYAIPIDCGDALFDSIPFRTFLMDRASGEDVGRVNHQSWDLVLHPHGYLHWPGRLRPPYTPPRFPNDERRTGVSLVYCGYRPHPPHPDRPLRVSPTRQAAAKSYTEHSPPFHLVDLQHDAPQVVGRVATSSLELLQSPARVDAPRGGYLLIVSASADLHAESDLLFIPPGSAMDGAGVERALWFSDATQVAEPPTDIWRQAPLPDFPPFEDTAPGQLPLVLDELVPGRQLSAQPVTDDLVCVTLQGHSAEVPRYWLARFLFRLGLHRYQIGYLETYGGFYYDDQGGHRLGLRGGGELGLSLAEMRQVVEQLYRAVAPPGYVEHI